MIDLLQQTKTDAAKQISGYNMKKPKYTLLSIKKTIHSNSFLGLKDKGTKAVLLTNFIRQIIFILNLNIINI